MTYSFNATHHQYKDINPKRDEPRYVASDELIGNLLVNPAGEKLGDINDFILDINTGRIAYVAAFFIGIIGLGEKLFVVPWPALLFDAKHKNFVVNIAKERLALAPSFDKGSMPDINDLAWREQIEAFFGDGILAATKQPSPR